MNETELAELIARRAHTGQTRRDGTPYIYHTQRVALSMLRPEAKAVAWLHDVLEDTKVTADELRGQGISVEVVVAVEALTREPEEGYETFIRRVRGNALAAPVKLADILDNLCDEPTPEQVRKYSSALKQLLLSQ